MSWVYCHSGRNISSAYNQQKHQLYFLNRLYWRFDEGDLTELQSVFLLFKNLWHLEVQRFVRESICCPQETQSHIPTHGPSHMPWLPCHAQVQDWVPFKDFPEFCVLTFVLFFFPHGLFLSLLGYFPIIHLLRWLILTANFVRPKITWETSHWVCLWGSF